MKLTTTDAADMNTVNALVVGASGIGKTTSLRTLPKEQTLIAASERSLLPLRGLGYTVAKIECWDDVREMVGALQKHQTVDGKPDGKPIRILAIDSLSDLAELCIKQIVHVDRRKLIHDRTKGKSEVPIGVYEEAMTMEDWGAYGRRLSAFISAAVQLPLHIVFTCLEQWKEDKSTGVTMLVPAMSGALAFACPKYFDIVVNMRNNKSDAETEERIWQTYNDGRILAKDSTGKLDKFEPTDWTKMFTKILNGKAKK